ncbi:MAG: hypothetical protein HKO66_02565 [Saprospiraceae bacterium]|nr:hypothetical protein [Saprospiraceae bacterium]NNL91096.1 hypothetical protein [Saprospiraceae bacterium]
MERLSLGAKTSYLIYTLLFYLISFITIYFLRGNPSNIVESFDSGISTAIYWCFANLLFFATIVLSAIYGLVVSIKKKQQKGTRFFSVLLVGCFFFSMFFYIVMQ